jgi:hypothetical protein
LQRPFKFFNSELSNEDLAIVNGEENISYRLQLRATKGLIRSFIKWGNLDIQFPVYSTLYLRKKDLAVHLLKTKRKKSLHAVKVFGEVECKLRQYGYSKHRT